MMSRYCPQCNTLDPKIDDKRPKSTSIKLLEEAVNSGCQLCRIILKGIQSFIAVSEDFEVELNSTNDGQGTLKVLVWDGLRQTRNPRRRSSVIDTVAPICLEFYTRPNKPSSWPVFGARPDIALASDSITCFEKIQEWIKNCTGGHADCQQPKQTVLPSRLIDVGSATSPPKIRLVETRGSQGTYSALSHCWGGHQPLTTTKATLHDRFSGIEWTSLPKTFQDAVTITRELGMQYIWIDSLAIIQDDNDDWEIEAANMGAIYERSLLTISASIASNPNHGIFSQRLQPIVAFGGHASTDEGLVLVRKVISHAHLSTEATKTPSSDIPLLTRAWAYQERLLATRVLHYLPDELFWECRSAVRCECGIYVPGAKLRHHSKRAYSKVIQRNQADPAKLAIEPWRWTVTKVKMWPQIVAEYSARDLTHRKDRLPALSGVAKQLHSSNPSMVYLAGLWLEHLPEALLWRVMKKRPKEGQQVKTKEGPLGRRELQLGTQTPSWSWASLEGDQMSIKYPEQKLVDEQVKIINAQTIPSGIDPFSSVTEGSIRLRGSVVPTILRYDKSRPSISYTLACGDTVRAFIPDTQLSDDADYDFVSSGDAVYCLLVGSFVKGDAQSLVLRESERLQNTYKRIGMLSFFDGVKENTVAGSWFKNAEDMEIILV